MVQKQMADVHYRIGSLEKAEFKSCQLQQVHYRIGSLETTPVA